MENKEKEVRETEPETTKEEDEHVKEMGMLSLDRRRNHQIELSHNIGTAVNFTVKIVVFSFFFDKVNAIFASNSFSKNIVDD